MSSENSKAEDAPEFTGRHMAMIMVAFFGVIITVNGYMAYVATTSWSGIMARNGYVASQDFNALKAKQRRQDSLGIQSRLLYGDEGMVFSLWDRKGAPLEGFKISLRVGRPSHNRVDRTVALEETEPGVYRYKLDLDAGQWNAEVIAENDAGDRHHRRVRIYVKQ